MLESLPTLLLAVPLVAALLIGLLPRSWPRVAAGGGTMVALLLYIFLTSVPLDLAGEAAIEWERWGQSWQLTAGSWTIMRLLYATAALLFLLALFWRQEADFIAGGLAALSPLAAGLMLPFASGVVALLIATVATVIMVQASGHPATATMRYFLLTTLALPFLLLAGWMLSSEQLVFVNVVWRLLAIGLALLLAGFPFHIWVRPLVVEAPSLALLFLFGLVHLVLLIFAFDLLQDNLLLENSDRYLTILRWSGVATALVGAVLTWQPSGHRHLLGALLLLDLGSAVVAVSLGSEGLRPALLLLLGRFISLFLVLTALKLAQRPFTAERELVASSLWQRVPWSSFLFSYGMFSLIGLPFTPGFPGRWAVLALAATHSFLPAMVLLLALAGGTVGLLTYLHDLADPSTMAGPVAERSRFLRNMVAPLLLAAALLVSLFPRPLLAFATHLAILLN